MTKLVSMVPIKKELSLAKTQSFRSLLTPLTYVHVGKGAKKTTVKNFNNNKL